MSQPSIKPITETPVHRLSKRWDELDAAYERLEKSRKGASEAANKTITDQQTKLVELILKVSESLRNAYGIKDLYSPEPPEPPGPPGGGYPF